MKIDSKQLYYSFIEKIESDEKIRELYFNNSVFNKIINIFRSETEIDICNVTIDLIRINQYLQNNLENIMQNTTMTYVLPKNYELVENKKESKIKKILNKFFKKFIYYN